ncbi:hypothetical protein MMD27_003531 [Acinetobacter baumannii]|nr:hypothetical protein [Acinetobacter baumannii]
MRSILSRVIEIMALYALIYFFCYYLSITISSSLWLITGIAIWLTLGHKIKSRLKYRGIFSSWYAPFTIFNERVLGLGLILITIYGFISLEPLFVKNIFYCVSIASAIHFISTLFLERYNKRPFIKTIILTSTIESYFITYLFLDFIQVNITLENIISGLLLALFINVIITQCNYYFLRNFIFYQKLIVESDNSLSYNQKLNIAVHETSHLLMYVFFKELPHDIQILLFKEAKAVNPEAQGLVVARVPMYNTKEFLEWRMMLSISGIRGELLIFNNHSHGSESDFQQWRSLAHLYLLNFRQDYTSQPVTASQMSHNKALETALYERQLYIIDKFLKKNKSLLIKISKQALVYNKLDYLQIYPHFKYIKRINEMPIEH